MEEYDERLKINTPIGILHGLFHNCIEGGYVGWFEERPNIIIQAESLISLEVMLKYKNEKR